MKQIIFFIFITIFPSVLLSQVVYEPVSNNPVYDFLDELETLGLIRINPGVKPYSRMYIAEKLKEAEKQLGIESGINNEKIKIKVSKRLIEELKFYLKDYGFESGINSSFLLPLSSLCLDPIGCRFSGKVFKISISPWLGGKLLINENGSFKEISGGGEVFGYIGRHIGYYANVKQTWQSEALVKPEYFTLEEGKVWNYKANGSVSNTEWRGGLSVAWKWGDFGVYKDRPIWGNGIHGTNILSGHAPSFPFIQLNLNPAKWIAFTYFHGWLNAEGNRQQTISNSNDSSNVQDPMSDVIPQKYMAANMLTLFPWKFLSISIGNSIVYSSDHIIPAFLIPFQFFKSTDQTLTSLNVNNGQNSQLFFTLDAYMLKTAHVWFSAYIEDLKMSALFSTNEINELGYKAGFTLTGLPLQNLSFSAEYTRTNPLTYKHIVTPTEYYSDHYCLGNYLRDDSQEFFISLGYKPLARLQINLSYNWAEHGIDYPHPENLNNYLLPFIGELNYTKNAVETTVRMQFLNDLTGWVSYAWQNLSGDIKYSPEVMRGRTNTLMVGVNLGL